ncbi:MAG: hypothetical protein ACOYMA_18330 [Bacteroidia bacterium]
MEIETIVKYIHYSMFATDIAIIAVGAVLLPICPPVGVILILGGSLLILGSIPLMYDLHKI